MKYMLTLLPVLYYEYVVKELFYIQNNPSIYFKLKNYQNHHLYSILLLVRFLIGLTYRPYIGLVVSFITSGENNMYFDHWFWANGKDV